MRTAYQTELPAKAKCIVLIEGDGHPSGKGWDSGTEREAKSLLRFLANNAIRARLVTFKEHGALVKEYEKRGGS